MKKVMPVKRTLLSQPRRNVGVDDGGVTHGGVLCPLLIIQARIDGTLDVEYST